MPESHTILNHSLENNILRPFKIQKVHIPPMDSILHYSESLNPHGIGTSSGRNSRPTSPATAHNQQHQHSTPGNQNQSPMSKKEDPFSTTKKAMFKIVSNHVRKVLLANSYPTRLSLSSRSTILFLVFGVTLLDSR